MSNDSYWTLEVVNEKVRNLDTRSHFPKFFKKRPMRHPTARTKVSSFDLKLVIFEEKTHIQKFSGSSTTVDWEDLYKKWCKISDHSDSY